MADTKDFLLEIGTEEMPSAPLINATKQVGKLVERGLDEAGLPHGAARVVSGPRRLAVIVSDVACQTDEVNEVRRGPAAAIAFGEDGQPTKAAQGFARKCGVDASCLVRREDVDGREYVFAERHVPAQPAMPILSRVSEATIAGLEWPNYRSQRWGTTHETFVRPVRWICALLGTEVVPVRYADVTSSNTTRGHRVLGPGEHVVADPASYESVLESCGVLGEQRRGRAGGAAVLQGGGARRRVRVGDRRDGDADGHRREHHPGGDVVHLLPGAAAHHLQLVDVVRAPIGARPLRRALGHALRPVLLQEHREGALSLPGQEPSQEGAQLAWSYGFCREDGSSRFWGFDCPMDDEEPDR